MINQIGIIGGSGKMGQMFKKAWDAQGLQCLISDETDLKAEQQILSQCDLVVISVPIDVSLKVLKRISASLHPGQILTDFTSIKSEIVPAMLKTKAEVISCHPMFGPTSDMRGQNIILLPTVGSKRLPQLKRLFSNLGLNVEIIKKWQDHDRLMSYIQALMHFVHIVFASAVEHSGFDIEELMAVASPVYRANFAFACRIISRDPRLYSHILLDNSNNQAVIKSFIDQANNVYSQIKKNDEKEVLQTLGKLNSYLGHFATDFSKESDFLVEQMTKFQQQKKAPKSDKNGDRV